MRTGCGTSSASPLCTQVEEVCGRVLGLAATDGCLFTTGNCHRRPWVATAQCRQKCSPRRISVVGATCFAKPAGPIHHRRELPTR